MSDRHVDIDAFVDGVLDAAAAAAAEVHLASCARCRTDAAAARRLMAAIAAQPVPDPGPAYWDRFAARLEPRLRPRSGAIYERLLGWLWPQGHWAAVRAVAAVATACLVVYVGMRGFRPADLTAPRGELNMPPPAAPEPHASAPPADTDAPAPPLADATSKRDSETAPPRIGQRQILREQIETNRRSGPAPEPAPPVVRDAAPEAQSFATAPPDAESLDAPPVATPRADERAATSPHVPPVATMMKGDRAESLHAPGVALRADDARSKALRTPGASKQVANATAAPQDPVVPFVLAAVAGDEAAAERAAGVPGVSAEDAATMRRWLTPGTLTFSPKPAPAPASRSAQALERAPSDLAAERWLALATLAAPRREEPALRAPVATIARALAPYAATDPRAAARARELVEWLRTTSATADERATWETIERMLPFR